MSSRILMAASNSFSPLRERVELSTGLDTLSVDAVGSWEWQNLVRVPSLRLRAKLNQDSEDFFAIRLELLRSIDHRMRRFSNQAQVNCSDLSEDLAALYGFPTWFCRRQGELSYCQILRAVLADLPELPAEFFVTPGLLCLGKRAPSCFRFLYQRRGGWLSWTRSLRGCLYSI